jgi:hypothetical protein
VLVDEKLNKKLGNKSFGQKMSILKQSPVWLDDFLRKQSSWNAAKIRDRSHEFAKMAFNKVWRV